MGRVLFHANGAENKHLTVSRVADYNSNFTVQIIGKKEVMPHLQPNKQKLNNLLVG
uniref:Uncharacterized protein n=1 Tax=Nelumbo nucifera TaxID=4432 RepID=A0A823A1C2_NELNU|nr:TPA_asm: hypothetical protein HUJ06_019046 [Nelumbo nucifera]